MATKDRTALKDEFKNGNLATGERFADLIDSVKPVQEPVADPAASGTSLTFIDSISQDADGKITATKKTLDLANAHELNPFKGWYATGDTLPTDGFEGAYLYFKDASELTGQTTIYRWNGTTYADTGTVVDTSNVQTFETGQAVNGTGIKDLNGDNDPNAAGVLSAEAGQSLLRKVAGAMDAIDLTADIGVTNVFKLYIDASTGLWKVPTGDYDCTIIEVPEGVKMVGITANNANVCRYAFLNAVGAAIVGGDTPDYADGYSNVKTINVGGEVIADVPVRQEGKGMYLYLYLGLASSYPYSPSGVVEYENVMPITIEKVAFTEIEVGKNKLNPAKIVSGKVINYLTGNEVTATNRGASDFIPVSRNGLTCNHTPSSPGGVNMGYAVYAADKTYIRGVAASGDSATYVYQEGDAYVRFSLNMLWQNLMVEEGDTVTAYEAYKETMVIARDVMPPMDASSIADGTVTIDKLSFTEEVTGKNKLNPAKIVSGKAINYLTGNEVTATNRGASDFIPVSRNGLTCNHTPSSPGGVNMGYAVYAADKTYIRGVAASDDSATYVYQEGDAYVRFSLNMLWQNLMVEEGNVVTAYEPYETHKVIKEECLPLTKDNIVSSLREDGIFAGRLEMLLPDKFYQVSGDTLQLFYRGLIRAVDLSDKFVNPDCAVGVSYVRMFESDSASLGDKSLVLTVYDDNRNVLANGSTVVKVVKAPVSPSGRKHVLLLGGSFIENNTIYTELNRRLTGTGGSPAGAGLTNISISRIGHEGWGWYDYTHDNRTSPANPFWIDGQLDVAAWVDAQGWGEGETLDVLYAVFAYNGLYSHSPSAFKSYIESFIETLPDGCLLVLAAPVLPNVLLSKMTTLDATGDRSNAYEAFFRVWEIYKMYKQVASEHENVEFESWCGQFDMEYGYPTTTHAVNTRKTGVTIPVATNQIHPSNDVGYLQLADAAYRSVVAHLCQGS